jgi:endonuclease G
MVGLDLTARPRLADLRRLGGPVEHDAELRAMTEAADDVLEAVRRPRRTPAEALSSRSGYREDFLPFAVPLPEPVGRGAHDVLQIQGSRDNRLDYTHFSVVMSRARRMALFTAVNIDAKNAVQIPRGQDRWSLDARIPDEAQIGEELYSDNLLDRGHLVRREDPNWGDVAAEADSDTFHFTNCSPQMGAFNQKTWLSLETYVLDHAKAVDERISVFTGPVLRSNDRAYRDVQIPTAYWKVVAFMSDAGRPSVTAYLVDQVEELRQLEATFGKFKTYQKSIRAIEQMTSLSFGGLADFDGFSNEERATGTEIVAELHVPGDIRV